MRGRRPSRPAVAVALVVLACQPKSTTDPEPVAPMVIEATQGRDAERAAELAAIADAIDPGPQEPLSAGLPDWMLASIGVAKPLPEDPAELRQLADADLAGIAAPDAEGAALLARAAEALSLSARAYTRIIRVARTLADLDGADAVRRRHIAEAVSFRRTSESAAPRPGSATTTSAGAVFSPR